ncbi:hypothetical protein, partial [Nocardioides sp.]|uniref:hypothetical protein n=1 Tax=Nocardioides sp. TaxID=35761 RepID=UPI002DA3E58D|nr:hypothetical protein [Nocardioides sp.]
IALAAVAAIAAAIYVSKRRSIHIGGDDDTASPAGPATDGDERIAAGTPTGNPSAHPSTPGSAPAQTDPAPTQPFEPPPGR